MPGWRVVLLASCLGLAAFQPPAGAQENRDLLQRGVVKILAEYQDSTGPGTEKKTDSIATGFLVGHRDERFFYIATACHSITGARRITVWLETNRMRALPARPLGQCATKPFDVGVLEVEAPQGRDLALRTAQYEIRELEPRQGETVFSMGHPNDLEWYVDKHTVNLESDPERTGAFGVTRGGISGGSSGGPVFDEAGRLAGMVFSTRASLGVAVKIGPLIEWLRERDVPLNMTRSGERDPGGRVVLSDSLTLSLDRADIRNAIAKEIDAALTGSRFSRVYLKPEELRAYRGASRDALIFEGEDGAEAFRLKVHPVIGLSWVIRMWEQIERPGDPVAGSGAAKLTLPSKRFFPNQFLSSQFRVGLDIPAKFPAEVRVAMARLAIQYAFGVWYFYSGDAQAQRWFGEAANTAKFLPAMNSVEAGRICTAISYYRAFAERNPVGALEMLTQAGRFGPPSPETEVARAYLLIASGDTTAAKAALEGLAPRPDDPAQLPALRGEYYMSLQDYRHAIPPLEEAVRLESDPLYLARLHLDLAVAHAALDGLPQNRRAQALRLHSGESLKYEPRSRAALALQAFGGALAGDGRSARASIGKLYRLDEEEQPGFAPDGFFEKWLLKAFAVLPETGRAELIRMAGDPEASRDSRLLAAAGMVLLGSGQAARAEAYINRAYTLIPNNPGMCELMAMSLIAGGTDRPRLERARELLRQALDTGGQTPSRHRNLADVYQRLGDEAKENEHNGLACDLSPKDPQCSLWRGTLAVRRSDFSEASRQFASARKLASGNAEIRLEEGIVWQKAGRLAEALDAYRDALRLDPDDFVANDNAGFVLFDLARFDEALAHFEAALKQRSGDADALGGKAITLEALGRHDAAVATFRQAIESDRRVLDPEYLQSNLMWSHEALRTVGNLRSEAAKRP